MKMITGDYFSEHFNKFICNTGHEFFLIKIDIKLANDLFAGSDDWWSMAFENPSGGRCTTKRL